MVVSSVSLAGRQYRFRAIHGPLPVYICAHRCPYRGALRTDIVPAQALYSVTQGVTGVSHRNPGYWFETSIAHHLFLQVRGPLPQDLSRSVPATCQIGTSLLIMLPVERRPG